MHYKISYDTWGKEETNSIKEVLKSGNYSMGSKVKKFEKIFANKIGSKFAVMTNSGSSANLLGVASQFFLKNNKLKRGDEVIVPALAWSTTYSPLSQYGLKLKIVDINLQDLNIDINLLKKAITRKTKMICAVNILGIPSNLNEIKKICKSKKILLYEDNCESLGAKISNKMTGSFGDFSSHSFFFSHHISTIEGGMITTNSYEIYEILKILRAHGWTRDLDKNSKIYKKKSNHFDEAYKFLLPGFNLRPNEINASIGIEQIKKLNKMIKIRRKNLDIFQSLFKNDSRFIIPSTKYYSSSFAFPIVIKDNKANFREYIFKKLKKNNIEYRLIAGGSFLEHPFKNYFDYKIFGDIKIAKKVHNDGFCIGNSSKDLSKEIYLLNKVLNY
tara:strand:- start:6901 stop:8061 length:1161 start_codon:yes stop_codon:yes gene_type:complete